VVDLLFERERVVIEVDGWRSHSGKEAFVQDRRPQNRLVALGYVVLRFTWDDLVARPDQVVTAVAAALASARRPG
jgi:very-short-patch-repair endonuclease